ncbi:hypothetical protein CCS01_13180 [Rhodopila globiformis]|uniref:Uncharacterized protein n=2 Tax=Rhodopila globiformis TaxID=1071 RepID=A0A2S6NGX8_RHOGL|nr:hypothetical protein CCS01_13180 [Rhodopila globiformis]
MSNSAITHDEVAPLPTRSGATGMLRRKLPYLVLLVLAIVGIAYTNFSHQPLNGFWEFLTIATGLVCIATAWPRAPDRSARFRLVWTQALHWITLLVAMNLVLLPGFQTLLPTQASSLVVLMLLALGTVLAGINLSSWEISFLGVALAASVPAIVWVKQSALFLLIAVMLIIGLGVAFWPRGRATT